MKVYQATAVVFAVLGAGILVAHVVPYDWVHNGPTLCLWKRFFGFECWGCGGTRALYHLLRGEFKVAYHYNRLIFLIVALAIFALFNYLRKSTRIRDSQ